jgi:hypothetical protein
MRARTSRKGIGYDSENWLSNSGSLAELVSDDDGPLPDAAARQCGHIVDQVAVQVRDRLIEAANRKEQVH